MRGMRLDAQRTAAGSTGGAREGMVRPSAARYVVRSATQRTSLVPAVLEEMEQDTELQQHLAALQEKGQAQLTREERMRRQRSLDKLGVPSFYKMVQDTGGSALVRKPTKTFQLNIGLYCNQACTHCHVESSPRRTETMDAATAAKCVELMRASAGSIATVDITGGAPELNPQFRYLVREARALGLAVLDRCNLTVLLEPGQEDLPAFLAQNRVGVVASLPCYSQKNVDQQRGAGVFERSIEGLKLLNAQGYGMPGTGLQLDLVYNPGGAFLAPAQAKLEPAYRAELRQAYGIEFSRLLCLNNMPIKRFVDFLQRRGQLDEYMQVLVNAYNPAAAESLMCRDTVSVGWDGRLYDCDFNQQLEMVMARPRDSSDSSGSCSSASEAGNASSSSEPGAGGLLADRSGLSVFDIASLDQLVGLPIKCDNHCYGCTAGAGSSCQGSLSSEDQP